MKQQTLGTHHFGGDQEKGMGKIPATKFGLGYWFNPSLNKGTGPAALRIFLSLDILGM